MKNIAFVIWMIGFPLVMDISSYLEFLETRVINTSPSRGPLTLIIYILIAFLLYEKRTVKIEDKETLK